MSPARRRAVPLGLLQQPHHGRKRARDGPQKEEKGRRVGQQEDSSCC